MLIKAYHGTGALFNKFEQSKARVVNDYYGGGVAYFTESIKIAASYAENSSKRLPPNDRVVVIYCVDLTFNKLFDTKANYTGSELSKFTSANPEQFARNAGLLTFGVDKYDVIAGLKQGYTTLTGDQVFKGLSGSQVNTAQAREQLKRAGYDGLKYDGGLQVPNTPQHNVYLAYYEKNIRITKREILENA